MHGADPRNITFRLARRVFRGSIARSCEVTGQAGIVVTPYLVTRPIVLGY